MHTDNTFWSNYFNQLNDSIRENIIISIIVVAIIVVSPLSFKSIYDNIYHGDVVGTIVNKDPRAHPKKSKSKIYYNYYANVYFPSKNVTKYVKVSENIHTNGLQGQSYYFKKRHVFQTRMTDLELIAISFHSSFFIVIFIGIILNMFSVYSETLETKKRANKNVNFA